MVLTASNFGGADTEAKIDYITVGGVGVNEGRKLKPFILYPNPTSGEVIIRYLQPVPENSRISVLNMLGEVLYESLPSETVTILNLLQRSEGLYIIKVSSGDDTYIEKVSVVR